MSPPTPPDPAASAAPPAVGCATCWAANYCAAFSLASSPPPACPLLPKPPGRPRRWGGLGSPR